MKVSVAIQHHPKRAHLLPGLLERLVGLDVEVVTDPDPDARQPSPMGTYTLACATAPAKATHRLVIQDDALPCDGFAGRMMAAVEERPDELLAFFAPGCAPHRAAVLRAQKRGEAWARLHAAWYPTVALLWPQELVRDFSEWVASGVYHKADGEPFRGDDGPVGEWCKVRRQIVWATVPSLVQHPDVEKSLIGRPNRAGKNRARVAAVFIDS